MCVPESPPLLQTVAMILGEEQAPWEDETTAGSLLKPLGYFRKPVLALLSRNPLERPTMEEFRLGCRRVLVNSTTA
jgi:hypothetical protein